MQSITLTQDAELRTLATPTLIYLHDPMCSWCWGFSPCLNRLLKHLEAKFIETELSLLFLLGGLAADSDQPMPIELQRTLQHTWRKIQQVIVGTEFNFEFWQKASPRRSTYPACRAVLAAKQIDIRFERMMIKAIQTGYYLHAKNPSEVPILIEFAEDIGLDAKHFAKLLHSKEIERQLQHNITLTRQLFATINSRGFPSLALIHSTKHNSSKQISSIDIDYNNALPMCQQIEAHLANPQLLD